MAPVEGRFRRVNLSFSVRPRTRGACNLRGPQKMRNVLNRPLESARDSVFRRRTLLAGMGALALSACTSKPTQSAGPAVEIPEIRLGVLKVTDTAPLFVAQREGIFE